MLFPLHLCIYGYVFIFLRSCINLDQKDEPQDVEQPHAEDHGVVEKTHAEPTTRHGRGHTMQVDRLRLDAAEHVGAPTSLCRQRQYLDRFTGYMALMSKCIVKKPSSFEEGATTNMG